MLKSISIDVNDPAAAVAELLEGWRDSQLKVFVLKAGNLPGTVKDLYHRLLPSIGTPASIAEDVQRGDRSQQRTGEIWMEVRYDPKFPDAYRHSPNAQPLHTDGSYIPDYPNATLMACEANAGIGGETTFLDSKDLAAAMQSEAPSLWEDLCSIPVPHARSGDRRESTIVRIEDDGRILVNWNYYCVDPAAGAQSQRIREEFHRYLLESPAIRQRTMAVKLDRGDAVTWKDEELLHGRNKFNAEKAGERFLWKCGIDIGRWP